MEKGNRKEEMLAEMPDLVKIETFLEKKLVEINRRTLRNWCLTGQVPGAIKKGKYWYINPRKFMRWFEDQRAA